jgi:hypothetical protein
MKGKKKHKKALEKKKIAELESRVCKLEAAVNRLKILSLVDDLSIRYLENEVSAAHDRLDWVHIP